MYYLIFIFFIFLLFNHLFILAIITLFLLIIFLFFKREFSFLLLFIFGSLILFYNYFGNINFKHLEHKEKFINEYFLITDFSETKGNKKIVNAFPFEIVYEDEKNFYRGQVVEIAGYLSKNKVYAREILIKREGNFIFKFFSYIRENLYSRIENSSDELFKSLVKSFIFGDRNSLDFETKENFRLTGLMHLLALSGLHIAIIAGFLGFILSFFVRKNIRFCLIFLFLVFYVFVSGFSPSVVRSGFMFIILYYSYLNGLRFEVFDILLLTAVISLILFPEFLFTIGFWLSYTSFAGIFFLSTYFELVFQKLPTFLRKSFSITFSANIATFPLMLHYFHSVNLICFLSNLIVIPLFSVFLICLFFAYILSFFSLNFYIYEFLWILIQKIVAIFSYIPFYLKVENFGIFNIFLFYSIFILMFFFSNLFFYNRLKKMEKFLY